MYIVSLKSGASLLVESYQSISSTKYRFKVIAKNKTFNYDCLKCDVEDITNSCSLYDAKLN